MNNTTNQYLKQLISELKKESYNQKAAVWKAVATNLERSTRSRRVVNLNSLNRSTKENEIVVVPGKVLGTGELHHPLTVAAFSFSHTAKAIIEKAKGKCLTISDLLKQHPQGKNVRLIG